MSKYVKIELTENQIWLIAHALRNDAVGNTPGTNAQYTKILKKLGYEL